jgi:hypothetical protein
VRTNLLTRAATVAATAGALVSLAAPAWAPKYILGASAHGDCVLDGATTTFLGDFTVTSFGAVDGALMANGTLAGTCGAGAYTVPFATYAFPVESVTGVCNDADAVVQVRPGSALVGAFTGTDEKTGERVKLTVDLNSTVAERSWVTGDPAAVRGRLCAVARLTAHAPVARLATALNALVLG